MTPETTAHIKSLHGALEKLRRAVEAADIRASLAAGANINAAITEAVEVEVAHAAWLLGNRE